MAEQPPNTELERFPKPISGRADGYLAVAKQKVQMGMHKTYLKSSKEKDAMQRAVRQDLGRTFSFFDFDPRT